MIVAGFDEAGYGPRLGPLTVGFTAFEVEVSKAASELPPVGDVPDLWDRLGAAVRRTREGDPSKVWVADSKEVKPQKDGLKQLELGALSFVASARPAPANLAALCERLGQPAKGFLQLPWYGDVSQSRVPCHAWSGEVAARSTRLVDAGARAGVRFVGAGARVLDEVRFNERVEATQNKAAVLGEAFVDLLRMLRAAHAGPMDVTVDKHGGRDAYGPMLSKAFPRCAVEADLEGAKASRYRVATKQGPLRITFKVEAELGSLPVALASMTCKYLRERFMDRLNAWFMAACPGLQPTAGYAQDATRFIDQIEALLPRLGVARDTLVRSR